MLFMDEMSQVSKLRTLFQNGGFVAFGGGARGGKITGKGKIRTDKLDFEDVFFVKELKFNLTECLVLSPNFMLLDASQVLLRVPRQSNMYSFDLKNVVPSIDLTCLFAKATIDESKLWHGRLGHVNFKTMNKLVKENLLRGLPSKIFDNDHTCVACQKVKQHKASCKAKLMSSISQPLQMLHMDLFGPTFVRSINHKTYCLVVTDDFSKFSWGFFLASKDETSGILKRFITEIENQLNHEVKVIRTPQQNGVAERKNRTLIESARTMLAVSLLSTVFWAEAVNTACYVLNRVLVTKPQNKTPYELITGKISIINYIRPFGCHMTILNTIDHLGKFDGKLDEGFLVGYSLQSKAFRVYNLETKRVEENLQCKVSTDSAKLVPLGKDSTAIETLKKIPPRLHSSCSHSKVAGKPVSISKASIRSDLLFDDANRIDSLPNQAIFDAIQLMGYEGDLTVLTFNKALFSPQWRHLDAKKKFVMYPHFISIFLDKQLVNVQVPLDHFLVNALTSKVFSFMVKKGKYFLGKVTPLFASMLVQSTEDEGATSERPSEQQPTPSPPHPSEANVKPQSDPSPIPSPTPHILDSIPKVFSGNHGGQSSRDKSISGNEGDMTLRSSQGD
ncbi:putative ribonuclease H-like domain-containing protein [Tanacetum coccineum]